MARGIEIGRNRAGTEFVRSDRAIPSPSQGRIPKKLSGVVRGRQGRRSDEGNVCKHLAARGKISVELQGGACAPPGQGRIKAGRLQVRASSFPTLAQGSPRSRAALPAKLPWVPGQPDGGIFFIEMAHLLSASPCNSHRLCPLCLPCFLRLLHLLHLLPIGAQENHFAS